MFSWRILPRKPLIVAHRGSSAHAPENTLGAFARARRDGADAIELDVQLSRDGHAVVIHDFTLRRTAGGSRARVEDTTLAELRLLNAGDHRSHEVIPLLDEVFELTGGSIGVNIELKLPRRSGRGAELVDRVVQVIRSHHGEASSLISSFNHRLILPLAAGRSGLATALLLTPLQALRPPFARAEGVRFFIAGKRSVTPGFVERCHRHGVSAGVFTVNGVREALRLAASGVEMLVTDDPLKLRGALELRER